jgi:hypothetical protein
MDRLTGRISAAPRVPEAEPARPPGAHTGSGPGYRYCASGAPGRAGAREREGTWLAWVGAPYGPASGADALGPVLTDAASAMTAGLAQLGGEFALARFAARERELVLATDRFASIPLYYALDAEGIAFGTDFAQVSAAAGARDVDPQALYDYLYFAVVPGQRTIRRSACRRRACSSWPTAVRASRATGVRTSRAPAPRSLTCASGCSPPSPAPWPGVPPCRTRDVS